MNTHLPTNQQAHLPLSARISKPFLVLCILSFISFSFLHWSSSSWTFLLVSSSLCSSWSTITFALCVTPWSSRVLPAKIKCDQYNSTTGTTEIARLENSAKAPKNYWHSQQNLLSDLHLKSAFEVTGMFFSFFFVLVFNIRKIPLFLSQFIDLQAKTAIRTSRITHHKSAGQRNWELNPNSFYQCHGSNSDTFQGHQQRKSCIITSHMSGWVWAKHYKKSLKLPLRNKDLDKFRVSLKCAFSVFQHYKRGFSILISVFLQVT